LGAAYKRSKDITVGAAWHKTLLYSLVVVRYGKRLFQGVFEGANSAFLHCGEDVAVSVEGNSYGGVSKHFRDNFGIDVAGEEQGSAGVPEVVEACIGRKTSAFEKPGERAVSEVGGVNDTADLVGEDEAAGPVEGT